MNATLPTWLEDTPRGAVLRIRAKPRSSRPGIEPAGDTLAVRVKAAPVDGKANKEIAETLAVAFGVAKSRVSIVSGGTSKTKRALLAGVGAAEAAAAAAAAMAGAAR